MTSGEDKDIDMDMVDMEHDVSYVLHTRILVFCEMKRSSFLMMQRGIKE